MPPSKVSPPVRVVTLMTPDMAEPYSASMPPVTSSVASTAIDETLRDPPPPTLSTGTSSMRMETSPERPPRT